MVKNEVKEFNVYGNVYGVSLWRSSMGTIFEMLNQLEGNRELKKMGFTTEWLIDQHNKLVEIAINLNKNRVEIDF